MLFFFLIRHPVSDSALGYIALASFNEEPLFSFIKNYFIYLFTLGCDGSSLLCAGFSLAGETWSHSPVVLLGLLIAMSSLVEERRL